MNQQLPKRPTAYRRRQRITSVNWLVHRLHDSKLEIAARGYAHGVLADIGCGEKPYQSMFAPYVSLHVGVDHTITQHDTSAIDVFGTAYDTTLADHFADTVLCTAVLEHLERPADGLAEMARIMRPGGYLLLSTVLFWHLHEIPRDFYRYTRYGLEHLLTHAGFEVVELLPLSGFVVTFCQELCYFILPLRRSLLTPFVTALQLLIQFVAYYLNRWDQSTKFTWGYLVVGRMPAGPRDAERNASNR